MCACAHVGREGRADLTKVCQFTILKKHAGGLLRLRVDKNIIWVAMKLSMWILFFLVLAMTSKRESEYYNYWYKTTIIHLILLLHNIPHFYMLVPMRSKTACRCCDVIRSLHYCCSSVELVNQNLLLLWQSCLALCANTVYRITYPLQWVWMCSQLILVWS